MDGIEVNNREAFYGNKNTKIFYELIKDDYNIGALSFSDGHSLPEIGLSYTLLEKPGIQNSEKLIESLRKSIKEHKNYSKNKQYSSFLSSFSHAICTIAILTKKQLSTH